MREGCSLANEQHDMSWKSSKNLSKYAKNVNRTGQNALPRKLKQWRKLPPTPTKTSNEHLE